MANRQLAAHCPMCHKKGWRVTQSWLGRREVPTMRCRYCGHERGPTVEEEQEAARIRELLT